MHRFAFLIVTLLFPLFLTGCSNHVQLSGRVTYSDDDTPLETGTVFFVTETFQARGDIKEDGQYVLSTLKPNDGLPPGLYKVYVGGARRYVENRRDGSLIEVSLITDKFTSAESSGLEVNVDRSTKTFDFQVDRAPGTKIK